MITYMKRIISVVLFLLCTVCMWSQTDRQFIRNGNKAYFQQNFVKAELEYRKSLAKNPSNPQALYNLGCALMMQKKDSAAIQQFEKAASVEKNSLRKSKSYHNIGVICQMRQMYSEAMNAYKESLRNNPSDNETRYNYVLCKRLNKNNQNKNNQNKNNQNKNNQNKKNKNKDDQNKNNKNKNQDKNEKKDNKKQNEKMSKDNAQQLLNAAMQEENATRQRIKEMMGKNQTRKLEKNW